MLEKTLESPLDYKEIQPVHPKGDQFWVSIGRTDAEAETPVLWPPQAKSWLIGKDPDAWRDWGQEEKGTTEDEMAGASPTRCTWIWVSSRSWWRTGKPGMLQSMGLQSQTWSSDWTTKRPAETMSSYQCFLITFPLSNKISYLESIWGWYNIGHRVRVQFSSVSQSCPTLCNPMDCSMPDFLVHHQLPLEKGMANHFSILPLRTPWTV